jgi:hypothetical protein
MAETGKDSWEDLYRYWRSRHVDGRPPARGDIDPPTEIPQFAANLMMIDILPDGYQYRLVGSALRERLGGELTGKAVGSSSLSEVTRREWKDLLDLVSRDQKPRMLVAHAPAGLSLSNLMLVLPLVDRAGKTERLLAGAFFRYQDFQPGSLVDEVTIREIDG